MPKLLRRGLVIVALLSVGGLLSWRMAVLAQIVPVTPVTPNVSTMAQFTPGPATWAPAASGVTPLGWSPTHQNTTCVTLSGTNNVTATGGGAGTDCLVYAINGQTTGKLYGEIAITGTVSGETSIGVANTLSPTTTTGGFLGYDTSTMGLFNGGSLYNNNASVAGAATFATGHKLCIALDMTSAAKQVWFANMSIGTGWLFGGAATGNPSTGANGYSLTGTGSTITANPVVFGADANPAAVVTITSNLACSGDPVYGWGSAYLAGFSPFPGVTNTLPAETWDPTRVAGTFPNTFSGDLLTVTAGTGANAERNTFGFPRFLSGSYYWQVTVTFAGTNANTAVGVANGIASAGSNSFIGQDNNSIGYYADGNVFLNNVAATGPSTTSPIATYTSGAAICVAVNYGAGLIWFQRIGSGQWNNAAIGSQSPSGNVGGFSISAITSSGSIAISPATVLYTAGDTAVGLFSGTPCSGVTGLGGYSPIP